MALMSPRRSLVEQAIDRLSARINAGDWPTGTRLPTEPELAEQLGMSRNTVREAVRVLAFAGVLEVRQGDGTYLRSCADALDTVRTLANAAHEHHAEVRSVLETQAARLAAERARPDDITALYALLDAINALPPQDSEGRIALDLRFHRQVVDCAHNPVLLELYRFSVLAVRERLIASLDDPDAPRPGDEHHRAIVDAIARGDGEAAAAAVAYIATYDNRLPPTSAYLESQ
ncbi:FCD domain-containing protein [Neisseriaceae bacterium JH1-16]|nr:FCD domain-containing protein [Neisseriaceae bacterium JH1-16]